MLRCSSSGLVWPRLTILASCHSKQGLVAKGRLLKLITRSIYFPQGQKTYHSRSSKVPARAGSQSSGFAGTMSTAAGSALDSETSPGSRSVITPIISQGSDRETVLSDLERLGTTSWSLDQSAIGIEKTFHFKTWTKCLDFVAVVGSECKVKNHHPTIVLVSCSISCPLQIE